MRAINDCKLSFMYSFFQNHISNIKGHKQIFEHTGRSSCDNEGIIFARKWVCSCLQVNLYCEKWLSVFAHIYRPSSLCLSSFSSSTPLFSSSFRFISISFSSFRISSLGMWSGFLNKHRRTREYVQSQLFYKRLCADPERFIYSFQRSSNPSGNLNRFPKCWLTLKTLYFDSTVYSEITVSQGPFWSSKTL